MNPAGGRGGANTLLKLWSLGTSLSEDPDSPVLSDDSDSTALSLSSSADDMTVSTFTSAL
jgi:hypothetical protein